MARNTDNTDSEKVIKETPVDRPAQRNYFSTANQRGVLWGLGAFVAFLLVFGAGAAVANHHHAIYRTQGFAGGPDTVFAGPMGRGERGFRTYGAGGGVSGSPENMLRGVVTSVNGNNFTVGGGGATTNVVTNSSTKYQNGNQVKQNDSVIVMGTSSNGTITATQVVINP